MKNEILDFIRRRFSKDCDWTNGNCLWFAMILKKRFPELEIGYMPIKGHFICIDFGEQTFYDTTGLVEPEEEVVELNWICCHDKLWYEHLIRDCFM